MIGASNTHNHTNLVYLMLLLLLLLSLLLLLLLLWLVVVVARRLWRAVEIPRWWVRRGWMYTTTLTQMLRAWRSEFWTWRPQSWRKKEEKSGISLLDKFLLRSIYPLAYGNRVGYLQSLWGFQNLKGNRLMVFLVVLATWIVTLALDGWDSGAMGYEGMDII